MSTSRSVRIAAGKEADLGAAATLIREVADFPEPGILFRDVGPVLADPAAFRAVVDALAGSSLSGGAGFDGGGFDGAGFDVVVGVEARGFLLGAAVAHACGTGVVGLRKPGKLPVVADREEYALEYGTATLELPEGGIRPGQRVLVVDDVLATGGTLAAARRLVQRAGAQPVAATLVLELAELGGRANLPDWDVRALFTV